MADHGVVGYRIGELARLANVTKRTIDYYTNIGILRPKRSGSNYRYYDDHDLEQLRFIEQCKRENLTLEEIKKRLIAKKKEVIQNIHGSDLLQEQIKRLQQDMETIIPLLENLDPDQRILFKKHFTSENMSLIQSLLLLLM
ncbi:MerR family transcriptional regulator [Bacillus canaveralius]|uniref:MerR family transcriptional regulator n=1 Tax=Bacillus canaveralius TaxID=1403243 RepID=UPI000F783B98|nr:MerR family transcriptional regulator [Bacillus canaveralius]RSK50585.1 MerR family transcriptional regulator [Bacillus canaveralius]